MKKIFVFRICLMSGTVTVKEEVAATATRDLAEKARAFIIESNSKDNLPHPPLHATYTDIEEVTVYEAEEEIPILHGRP